MANKERANTTVGATGPRVDETENNTVSGQAQANLLATFDEVDFADAAGALGITPLNPQERHGPGANSVSGQSYYGGPNAGANDDPNIISRAVDPNDAGYASLDGSDFSETPRNLPHIEPREGFSNCWVRWFEPNGEIDRDLQRMIRRGYTPVPVDAVSKRDAMFLQKRKGFDGSDMLSVSGMVLCEIPLQRLRQLTEAEKLQHRRNEKATLQSAQDANRDALQRGSGSMQIGYEGSDR